METICYVRANSDGELEFSEEDQTHWKHKWTKDVVTYQLQKDSEDIEGTSIEKRGVNLAMSTWNFEIPLKLRSTRNDNPDVYINFCRAKNDEFFKDRKGILAYAYYPKTQHAGKIVFNEDFLWTLNGKPVEAWKVDKRYAKTSKTKLRSYNMIHVLIHEMGHCLGLTHDVKNEDSVMWWQYNGQLHLHDNDIKRITKKYGKRKWNPRILKRVKRWLYNRKERL